MQINTTDPIRNNGLDALEQAITRAHVNAGRLEGEALKFAIQAGSALIETLDRKLIRHGQKTAFYIRTCGSKQTASVYITLVEHRGLIEEANVQRAGRLSIRDALQLIRQEKGTPRSTPKRRARNSPQGQEPLLRASEVLRRALSLAKIAPMPGLTPDAAMANEKEALAALAALARILTGIDIDEITIVKQYAKEQRRAA
jgi:hypothetical protein